MLPRLGTSKELSSVYWRCMTRWWQLKHVEYSPRKLGKINPFWLIFFRLVETTNQMRSTCDKKRMNNLFFFSWRLGVEWYRWSYCSVITSTMTLGFSGWYWGQMEKHDLPERGSCVYCTAHHCLTKCVSLSHTLAKSAKWNAMYWVFVNICHRISIV